MEQEQDAYLVIYVDDLLMFSKSINEIKRMKMTFYVEFDMQDLKEFTFCLGIQMIKDLQRELSTLVKLNAQALEYSKQFGMEKSKALMTPLDINIQVSKK